MKKLFFIFLLMVFLGLLAWISLSMGPAGKVQAHYHSYSTPTPTEEPTATPNPTPTEIPKEPCEEGYHLASYGNNQEYEEEQCVPDETPTPTVEITREPEHHDPVGCTQNCGGSYNAPVCNGVELKPADVGTGVRIDSDTVEFHWNPSTDAHDKQVLLYGPDKDNLPYSVFDIAGDLGSQQVNGLTSAHWWAKVGTWRDSCISWSETFDP